MGRYRVDENTAFDQVAVNVSHHRSNVTRGIWATGLVVFYLAIFDIFFNPVRKMGIVTFIYRIDY